MIRRRHLLCAALLVTAQGQGQITRSSPVDRDYGVYADPRGAITALHGFNASLTTSSQHDSSNDWSSILTPDLAWRFNRHFSLNGGVPLFNYIVVDTETGPADDPDYELETRHHALGDIVLSGHFETHRKLLDYSASVTVGLPTGKPADGLGAGKVTYALENHAERTFGIFTPEVELSYGTSSNLLGAGPILPYVAVARLAYLQVGASVALPRNINFTAVAFEELPLGHATIFSTSGKVREEVTTASGSGSAEDNGFNTSLELPVARHISLTGFYTRSLIDAYDIAGFSLTFRLRDPTRKAHD